MIRKLINLKRNKKNNQLKMKRALNYKKQKAYFPFSNKASTAQILTLIKLTKFTRS